MSKNSLSLIAVAGVVGALMVGAAPASAATSQACKNVPDWATLKAALQAANDAVVLTLNHDMWATIVSSDGTVCAIAFSGSSAGRQWRLSRIISAQKANTANGLSLSEGAGGDIPGLALSTANLWAPTQPGGSLWELPHSNPVDATVAYAGNSKNFGKANDPLVGKRIGGVNVFGGGLGLYNASGHSIGGVGVSGDTSCRDHMVAWELRHNLGLDYVPAGVSGDPQRPDNIIFDTANAFGHPTCLAPDAEKAAAAALTPVSTAP